MNKLKRIAFVLMIITINCCFLLNVVSMGGVLSPDKFEDNIKLTDEFNKVTQNTANTVISVARIAGVTIALTMLLIIAMKYMVSSPGDRADIKKHAVAYVVGAFIVFGVTQILALIVEFSNSVVSVK